MDKDRENREKTLVMYKDALSELDAIVNIGVPDTWMDILSAQKSWVDGTRLNLKPKLTLIKGGKYGK